VAREFFEQPASFKERFGYTDVDSNFGYQRVEGESLDPKAAPDLKEAFTMRGALLGADHTRFPSETFSATAREFFDAAFASARELLRLVAASLELPDDFFVARHRGENVTLRFLHYPRNLDARTASQLGAGAHTDYGSITLLFQDDVGGLELRDASDVWRGAPPIPGAIVVNAGDLMERWTNGRYRSTLHRVSRITGPVDRYAIAMFVDPDSDVLVECLPSCRSAREPARFPPITAGEHVRQKIAASHG
jgi:isopenicillin N synthase-like dioxygenase